MKNWLWIAAAALVGIPAIVLRLWGIELAPHLGAIVFGIAIVGGAFLLTWAAGAAQKEISQALALALLALIAVLPEYAVDIYFAWMAGIDPQYAGYAAANMTGANRLLIGIGWPLVAFLFWMKRGQRAVVLEKGQRVELTFLVLATIYSFIIPIKGTLSLLDSVVLVSLFALYIWASSRVKAVEPELVGPSATIAALPRRWSRLLTAFLFILPAGIILASAEPFAEGLIQTGKTAGIDEFILVQWVAPLASEAPEILIASILTLRGNPTAAMVVLISSKVNQWTLLIGTLPVAYCISLGGIGALPLDARQVEEVLLTGAQSAFAIAILARLRFSLPSAAILFLLFITQLVLTMPMVRWGYAGAYLFLALVLLLADGERRRGLWAMMRTTFSTFRD
ncbi:MAG: sodium:calcium antiporter [Dehalococcoidia bacterium]|nr:sodium:calcium antiporter [Dehalococcoidia bacterium]